MSTSEKIIVVGWGLKKASGRYGTIRVRGLNVGKVREGRELKEERVETVY